MNSHLLATFLNSIWHMKKQVCLCLLVSTWGEIWYVTLGREPFCHGLRKRLSSQLLWWLWLAERGIQTCRKSNAFQCFGSAVVGITCLLIPFPLFCCVVPFRLYGIYPRQYRGALFSQARVLHMAQRPRTNCLFPPVKTQSKQKIKLEALKRNCKLYSWLYVACQTCDGNLDQFFSQNWPENQVDHR